MEANSWKTDFESCIQEPEHRKVLNNQLLDEQKKQSQQVVMSPP